VHVGTDYFVDNLVVYNISEMKLKGVKDDNGTLFSRLTNDEIKDQMDYLDSRMVSQTM
jgi:hypothetical protein